jgi:hypothetical protein
LWRKLDDAISHRVFVEVAQRNFAQQKVTNSA